VIKLKVKMGDNGEIIRIGLQLSEAAHADYVDLPLSLSLDELVEKITADYNVLRQNLQIVYFSRDVIEDAADKTGPVAVVKPKKRSYEEEEAHHSKQPRLQGKTLYFLMSMTP
jgi:hypothetical protein